MSVEKQYLSVNEVAVLLGVTPKTIYRWIDKGEILPTRLPNNLIRVKQSYLNKILESRTNYRRQKVRV